MFQLSGSPQNQQHVPGSNRKQSSQDDLDRISRVTSGAPIEMGTGSLGRRTLESLQEIERNRQRHLAQQGNVTCLTDWYNYHSFIGLEIQLLKMSSVHYQYRGICGMQDLLLVNISYHCCQPSPCLHIYYL